MASDRRVLGTEPEVGFYRFRAAKGAPWQACRIIFESGCWICLVMGKVVEGSGAADPFDIPFLVNRWPMHPISEATYDEILQAHEAAPAGHPLRKAGERVDLRNAPALYGRKP